MRNALLLSSALLAANFAQAADPAPLWKGDIEFGFYQTEGNTDESSLLGKFAGKRSSGLWTYDIVADGKNSETEGVRSAERYFLSNRLAYDVSEFNYTFGYVSVDKDRFSGYRYQGTVSGGYGRRILKNDTVTWDAEFGPGLRVSELENPGPDDEDGKVEEAIIRLSTELVAQVSDNASFSQLISSEAGDENTVTKSVSALKTKIVGGFGLKISYTIEYNETVPNDTVHMDRQTAVTLVYSF
ncbi:DUF481 domain-containing protein [Spongiibacter nanhainus]|uniref:DUF481 domain-containing protein n=1 Tax=Spongiibacter nanhainus TaxID=2794344 RepID=A0A7T4UPE9_9GAMM|nr:DUF481 domain-containing protein [Spongiibacter nanhainus]QQD17598.1 DUF481 domain-containing protein [Spongiibacter nanhainus]